MTPDAALAQSRLLFSLLSTPKLRSGLGRQLAGEGAPTDPSVRGPLSSLRWLSAEGDVDREETSQLVATLTALRADGAVLHVDRVERLPELAEERVRTSRRIVRLVWERLGGPRALGEGELGAAIAMFSAEVAQVRRDAVDTGLLRRTPDGARYEMAASDVDG